MPDLRKVIESDFVALHRLYGFRTQLVVEAEAREQFPCPRCKVPAGWACTYFWWFRRGSHKERVVCAALVNGGVDARFADKKSHALIRASSRVG